MQTKRQQVVGDVNRSGDQIGLFTEASLTCNGSFILCPDQTEPVESQLTEKGQLSCHGQHVEGRRGVTEKGVETQERSKTPSELVGTEHPTVICAVSCFVYHAKINS